MHKRRVYLDHNATSPLRPEAREAMLVYADCGNPSSIHAEGRAARDAVETARETVASLFKAKPRNVYFTSGGTEAANTLLHGASALMMGAAEHACVRRGHRLSDDRMAPLTVDGKGVIEIAEAEKRLAACEFKKPTLAIQAANNETGVVQPIAEIAALARSHKVPFVCDGVQAVGRIPWGMLRETGALFISAHKFGGPKGAGAIILFDEGFPLKTLIAGGGQEQRRRSGTENVAGLTGLAASLIAAVAEQGALGARLSAMQAWLEGQIRSIAADAVIFGEDAPRLPNTTCFAIPGLDAETMLIAFDLEGVAVSSGSACSSGRVERSHVLAAMGVAPDLANGAIRVSTGWTTEDADAERFLAVLAGICRKRRGLRAA